MENNTLNALIDKSCREYKNRPAMGMAFQSSLTYKEVQRQIISLAAILADQGIKKNDRVAILSENCPNWGIAYFAIVRLGAQAVPILPDFTGADARHILIESQVKALFISQRQTDKIFELERHNIKIIVTIDDSHADRALGNIMTFSTMLTKGDQLPADKHEKVQEEGEKVGPDDLASYLYTSGTSGHSKAVMLSHGNLMANIESACQLADIPCQWTFLSILPMSHTYEFSMGLLMPLFNGCRIVYAGKAPTPRILERICAHEKPEAMCVVPMIMEKIYKKRVMTAIDKSSLLTLITKIAWTRKKINRKIGSKLLDFFGGNLKLVSIGGAPLNRAAENFLSESGFPYIVGYGLTETSPLLAAGPLGDPEIAIGSCSKPVPGVEIRIDEPDAESGIGEIKARGANIMHGYYNQEELTAETIDRDGWLATGDLGRLDEKGNLHIMGRSKNVIVLAHGENIYPETIEEKLNSHKFVVEALVLESHQELEARVHLDYDLIDQETGKKSPAEQKEFINTILTGLQKEVNSKLPVYSRIKQVKERQEPFIKTATHKIKRYLYN